MFGAVEILRVSFDDAVLASDEAQQHCKFDIAELLDL